jgi:Flp pilus assembly protein TadD
MVRAEQYMALAVRAGYPRERALVAIVDACLASSRLRAALAYAEPHLRRHPDAWRVRLLVAAVHAALGRHERAVEELHRITQAHPTVVEAHHELAVLYDEQLGDEHAARRSFHAYLAHAPDGEHAAEARAWLAARSTSTPIDRSEP